MATKISRKEKKNDIEKMLNYEYLLSSWESFQKPQNRVYTAEDMVDNLNIKVANIHKELSKSIDLQSYAKIGEQQFLNSTKLDLNTINEIRKNVFRLQENRKKQQNLIESQKIKIAALERENYKLKQQILLKEKYASQIQSDLKNFEEITNHNSKQSINHLTTCCSESDQWLQLVFHSPQVKITLHSPHISESKKYETSKTLNQMIEFLEKKLTKDSSIASLAQNKNQAIIQQKILKNTRSLNNFKYEIGIGSQIREKNTATLSTFTQVRLNFEKKKRFHRSPVINRIEMLKRRLVDRY